MDFLTKKQRSRLMARIRSVSKLELSAKAEAERIAGCRLRRGESGLPGRPDYFNKRRRTAVFVHGCFWHACPEHGTVPESNAGFWSAKLARNKARDAEVLEEYRRMGWNAMVLWEHSLKARSKRAKGVAAQY
jgi:DNA mismatch endonuclease (patch repair protein)